MSKRVRDAANTSWHTSIEADCSAPEVLGLLGGDFTEESSYASPADMWSLGYLAHWLLTKHYPLSKFALPRYCRLMDPVPLSELANKGVSDQAMDFVKNLLHLTPGTRMTAQEANNHPWLALPDRGSMPSLERSITSYPLQQTRRCTSVMSDGVSDGYGTPQFAASQGSRSSNWANQTLGHKPLYHPSGAALPPPVSVGVKMSDDGRKVTLRRLPDAYRDLPPEAAPFLIDSDHQIEHASGINRSAPAPDPDLDETQEKVVALRQKESKAETQEAVRAKIQEAVQRPEELREDRKPHYEPQMQQRDRKVVEPKFEDEREEKEPDPVEIVSSSGEEKKNEVRPIAESRKSTDIQPMKDDDIDNHTFDAAVAAWEAENALLEAKEALNEEEYMKQKAIEKDANRKRVEAVRKREEERVATNDASMKEAERRAEEKETRHEEERRQREVSGSADDIKSPLMEVRSGNHDETGDLGGVDSEAIDFAATLPQYDFENVNEEREGHARFKMPPQELGHMERKVLKSFIGFAASQKQKAFESRRTRASEDRHVKLSELRQFSKNFTLKTVPPADLIGVLAKDPAKQEAIVDSYRKQLQEDAEILQQIKPVQQSKTAQLESTKYLSESMGGSQQKNVESHSKPSWAKVVASGGQGQEPAKKASTDTDPVSKQKRRRKKRGANGG